MLNTHTLWLPVCDMQVLVVSACAFDSVPADLGVCFAASCLPQGYHLHTVESFLSIDTGTTQHFLIMKQDCLVMKKTTRGAHRISFGEKDEKRIERTHHTSVNTHVCKRPCGVG